MKRMYYYLFYKIYKHYTNGPSVWWSEWKASFTLGILEIWLLVSLAIYYKLFINSDADVVGSEITWLLPLIALVLFDYFVFHHRDQWKGIVAEFDRLPKEKNRIGGWITFGVVLLIIANFIFSLYLYYQS